MAGPQYVYLMQGVSKTYPGGKQVFENIHLSFLPDAKIGVVGVNGAGKSTLLKIMAGVETEFNGEAWAADGIKVGYLPQEPQLDQSLSVFENVAAECPEKQLLDQFNAVSMKLAEDYTDELMEEMTALQEQVEAETRVAVAFLESAYVSALQLNRAATSAEMALEIVINRYREGEVDVTALLDAQRRARIAREQAAAATFTLSTRQLTLERVAGLLDTLKSTSDTAALADRIEQSLSMTP